MNSKRTHKIEEDRDDGSVPCKRSKGSNRGEGHEHEHANNYNYDCEDATEEETVTEHEEEDEEQRLLEESDDDDDDCEAETESDDSFEDIDTTCTGVQEMWNILLTDLWKLEPVACQNALEQLVTVLDSELDFTEKLSCFMQLGGQFALVSVLERWPDNPEIQEFGCSVFALLTNDEAFVHNGKTLAVACGLQSILLAMKRFPSRRSIQISGCCVLSRCCCIRELATFAVYEMNCVSTIVDAMMHFDKDSQVLKWGCWSLCTLSRWKKCRPLIVDAGGFGLLAFVIGRDRAQVASDDRDNDEELHEATRKALKRLVTQKDKI